MSEHPRTGRLRHRIAAVMLGSIALVHGCAPKSPNPPAVDDGVAIELPDLKVAVAELRAFDDYLDALDPNAGRKLRTRALLERHILPLALARAAFPAVRAEAFERARSLCAVVGNSLELERHGEVLRGERLVEQQRTSLPLAVAAWADDETKIGAVSPPIETPDSIWVCGLIDLHRGLTMSTDRIDLYCVRFPAVAAEDFQVWYAAERERRRHTLIRASNDVLPCLPDWLTSTK
ncbi:MAG: hypothetical protein AB7I19_15415 [Planctomycetota bacterium]